MYATKQNPKKLQIKNLKNIEILYIIAFITHKLIPYANIEYHFFAHLVKLLSRFNMFIYIYFKMNATNDLTFQFS
jgi:hypothetical protein